MNATFIAAALAALTALPAQAQTTQAQAMEAPDWKTTLEAARGQTVYWNAWGGSDVVNGFIDWIGERAEAEFGVTLEHVKLTDTAEAVSRVLAEKSAGKDSGGAIDLIWINGENFAAMKREGLLLEPWALDLPNWALLDPETNAALTADFTVPTEGMESPWGMAQLVFFHDSARLSAPPRSMAALAEFAAANPGRAPNDRSHP